MFNSATSASIGSRNIPKPTRFKNSRACAKSGPWLKLNVNAFNRVTAQQLANNVITLSPTFAGIRAAAYDSSDVSLIKHFTIREGIRFEARADALNIFNQTSFGVPNTTPTSAAFGTVTTQKNVPRRIQAMLRITF